MKPELIYLVIILSVLLILVFYFATAKGEKRKVTLINSEGSEISVDVEVADNFTTKAKGLMFRESLGEHEGMLFVFDRMGIYSLWMMNTTIPLDAIYIAEDGSVVEIIGMEPCGLNVTKCRIYTPKAEAKYILEVNRGFSEKNMIEAGKSELSTDFS
jgi:uncharacterized membrane protein (UPF0127 family)